MKVNAPPATEHSYWAMRRRLVAERGPARAHQCGCGSPAVCWSYIGDDRSERTEPSRGYRYSLDLDRYRPRCRACHRAARTRLNGRADVERAARLYVAGASAPAIAHLLGIHAKVVYQALRAHGVPVRHRRPREPHTPG